MTVPLSPTNLTFGGDTTGRHFEYLALADAYDAKLAAAGLCYPATAARFGQVCMELVAAESGIAYETLAHKGAIRSKVMGFVKVRKTEPRVRPRINAEHTVAELLTICMARLQDEQPDDAGLFVVVNALLLSLGKSSGFASDAATALSGILPSLGNNAELYSKKCLEDARLGQGAPKGFDQRLKFEFALRGVSPRFVAHVLGLKQTLVERWANGHRRPTAAHDASIRYLEDWLELDRGALWSLIGEKRVRAGHVASRDVPPEWRNDRYRRLLFKRAVPSDFALRAEGEKAVLAAKAVERLARKADTDRGKLGRQRQDRYFLKRKDFTPRLIEEFAELRLARSPKVMLFNDIDQSNGWNDRSFEKWQHRICGFLGFLHRRMPELINVLGYRSEDVGHDVTYENVALQDLTLGFMAVPSLVVAYERWLNWRKTSFGREGKPTTDDIEFVRELERLCRPTAPTFEDQIAGL